MISIKELLAGAGDLKPLSPTATRLAAVVGKKESSIDEVADVIEFDQAMTIEVLKLANSAMAAARRSIMTVREAVIRLGGGRILEHLVARHVRASMTKALELYGYAENDLWRHSVASACAAELLPRFAPGAAAGPAFTAALLHDIGKLLMVRSANEFEFRSIWALIHEGGGTSEEIERQVLGYSHADVGAEIGAGWNLPAAIVNAIREHHSGSTSGEHDPVTDCVRIANATARVIGEGIGIEGMGLRLESAIAQRIGLSRENYERLCAETALRFSEVISGFGL